MRIAVLGMGRMGQALAGRLLDNGHAVTIWNRTSGKAKALVTRGAVESASIPDAVGEAELVITSLANDDAVKEVALSPDGIRSVLAMSSTFLDASTIAPSTADELADSVPRFVAMPILGPPAQVASGDATYLIGAARANRSAVDNLFPGLSDKHISYDRPSTAAAAKLTVNLLLLNAVVALSEAVAAGTAGGLSEDQLRELLGQSPMVAPGVKTRWEGVLTGDQEPWWSAALGAKDADLVVQLARAGGIDLPMTSSARTLFRETAARFPDGDIAAVSRLFKAQPAQPAGARRATDPSE